MCSQHSRQQIQDVLRPSKLQASSDDSNAVGWSREKEHSTMYFYDVGASDSVVVIKSWYGA